MNLILIGFSNQDQPVFGLFLKLTLVHHD